MNRSILISLGLAVVVALGAIFYILQPSGGGVGGQPGSTGEEFRFSFAEFDDFQPIHQPVSFEEFMTPHWTDTAYGDPEAPVVMVEYFSYACPHCRDFHQGTYQQILADYVDAGLVYFVKRDFLLNSRSVGFELLAGAGAQCFQDSAQSQAFADQVFAQQRALTANPNPAEALVPVFMAAGMEEAMARSCMAEHRNRSLVFGRSLRAAEIGTVTGTPTIFINGEKYAGSSGNYNEMRRAIELALALNS